MNFPFHRNVFFLPPQGSACPHSAMYHNGKPSARRFRRPGKSGQAYSNKSESTVRDFMSVKPGKCN